MPRAKTQTKSKIKKPTKDLELSLASPEIDLEKITQEITEKVSKELEAVMKAKVDAALSIINTTSSEQRRDRLVLTGSEQYTVDADADGLSFNKNDKLVFIVGKNGQLGTGTRSPRSFGQGSVHFKAGAPSEAIIPTSGKNSTRGLIVEGDGDDASSYVFRAVSRMNRQGFNVFSDGSASVGLMNKIDNSTFSVYHRHSDGNGLAVNIPAKDFENTGIKVSTSASPHKRWKAISVSGDMDLENPNDQTEVFKVDGSGSVFAGDTVFSNTNGYAEFFEWQDGNRRDEDRTGMTVSINKDTGKIYVADDETDDVLGVVVPSAAFAGNSRWSNWHNKYLKGDNGFPQKQKYEVVEWLEMENTTLTSLYKDSLPKDFALPDNAVILETDSEGEDFYRNIRSVSYDPSVEYLGRQDRQEWAMVCVLGSIPIFKGQLHNPNWITLKNINDELELVMIK